MLDEQIIKKNKIVKLLILLNYLTNKLAKNLFESTI